MDYNTKMILGDLTPQEMDHGHLMVPEKDFDKMMSDLQSGRLSSSDGEFSEIAKREIEKMSKEQWETLKSLCKSDGEMVEGNDNGLIIDNNVQLINSSSVATGSHPGLTNWPGEFSFGLEVLTPKKKRDATFEPHLKKLYVQQNRAVSFNISYDESVFTKKNIQLFEGSLQIRTLGVFTEAEWHSHPVSVCYEHSRNSVKELKNPLAEHLIRCLNQGSTYHRDPKSGRFSVLTCLPLKTEGSMETQLNYKFMDLVGCSGGINRRDMSVLFSLEYLGVPVGRQLLPIRICANPFRDRKTEMSHIFGKSDLKIKKEGSETTRDNKKVFWVPAFDRETYETLLKMAELAEKLKPDGHLEAWKALAHSVNNKPTDTEGPSSKKLKM